MSINSKMTAIADAIRAKTGKQDLLSLDAMATEIASIETSQLNFEVVGGTTEPTSPIENTIWINTDIEITNYVFSATEPTSPVNGMVWIRTGFTGEADFNALKDNCITLSPTEAGQYNNGVWQEVEAKTYIGGEWIEWTKYLYNYGNQYTDITGGWTVKNDSNAKYAIGELAIIAGFENTGNKMGGCAHTINKIPFDGTHTTLYAEVEVESYLNEEQAAIIGLQETANNIAYRLTHFITGVIATESGIVSVDISQIASSYYVVIGGLWNGRVKRIWWK